MKTFIFATGLLFLSIAALTVGWYWGLYPYDHFNDLGTGLGAPDPNADIQEIRQFIYRRYPFHLVDPTWLRPKQPSVPTPKGEFWETDLRAMWALYETRARVVFVFIAWFAAIMCLFRFTSYKQVAKPLPQSG